MNKILTVFFIFVLLVSIAACSNVQTTDVKSDVHGGDVKTEIVPSGAVEADNVPAAAVKTDDDTITISAISDIKKDELLGKTVRVKGIVVNNLKTSSLSGYRLKDSTDSIPISSQTLPKVNTTVSVKGTLQKGSYFGYYITAIE
jgi:hypothetical protein